MVVTDAAGDFALALRLNSEIMPAGTFWRVTCGGIEWSVMLSAAGTWGVGDPAIQVVSPVPPGWVPVQGPGGLPGAPGAPGAAGAAATVAVGTVTTLTPGSPATVTNSGSSSAAVLDFGIPQGAAGGGGGGLSGTGSPEGAVTASPGATYTDTAGTCGAWQWVKVSGTGNTGWQVVYGDTGWRDMTAT